MDSAEFDVFTEEYRALRSRNIRASSESPEFFAEYKLRDIAEAAAGSGRKVGRILDFGGADLPEASVSGLR